MIYQDIGLLFDYAHCHVVQICFRRSLVNSDGLIGTFGLDELTGFNQLPINIFEKGVTFDVLDTLVLSESLIGVFF